MPQECATFNLTRLLRVIANVPTGTGLVRVVSSMPQARRRRPWGVIDSHISSAFLCMVRVEPLCKCCRGRSINDTAVNSTCGARALVLTSWQQSTGANTHIQNQITRAHTRTRTHTNTNSTILAAGYTCLIASIHVERYQIVFVRMQSMHLISIFPNAVLLVAVSLRSVLAVLQSVRLGRGCGFIVLNNWNNSHTMAVRVPSCPQLVQPPISPNHSVNPRDCARAEIAPRPALRPCRLWPTQDAGVQCVIEPSGGSGGQKWATARVSSRSQRACCGPSN